MKKDDVIAYLIALGIGATIGATYRFGTQFYSSVTFGDGWDCWFYSSSIDYSSVCGEATIQILQKRSY